MEWLEAFFTSMDAVVFVFFFFMLLVLLYFFLFFKEISSCRDA